MLLLEKLFDPFFLKRLESLRIECRKLYYGNRKGNYESANKKGTSLEFADYQEYSPGDDFRYIDWNLYSRLDKLLIKTFKEELELTIHILLDSSKSMSFPPEDKKFEYAKKIAIAFSYIGLSDQNSVSITPFLNVDNNDKNSISNRHMFKNAQGSNMNTPFFRKRSDVFRINNFLNGISPSGQIDFNRFLKQYVYKNRNKGGTILIISDFMMDPEVYKRGLSLLRFNNYDIKVIQILGAKELDPFQKIKRGHIIDVETNERKMVNITASVRKKYKDIITKHNNDLKEFCRSNKIVYSLARSDVKFEDYILKELPKLGFVK
ncbi:MAG: DUF58 domain-containing protein [Candidatus Anammoxibacter sp.]